MKYITRLLALLMLLLTALTAAYAEEPLAAWPDDQPAPNQIVHAGEWWYASMGNYGKPDASLAIGTSPETLTTVYTSYGYIWGRLIATEEHAAWVEQLDGLLSWRLHTRESGETVVLHTEPVGDVRPCFSVGLDAQAVYYVRTDAANGTAEVIRRSLGDGSETVLHAPGCPISALTLAGEELVIAQQAEAGWQLLRLDAENGDMTAQVVLPESIALIYSVDYEPDYDYYALYYYDAAGEEHASIYMRRQLLDVYTFVGYTYAYNDALLLQGTHMIWTVKNEVSGKVADNFCVVDVDLSTGSIVGHEGSFCFMLDGEGMLLLSFDTDNDRILLEQAR